jgi:2-dehydropantoate 2-reductase
MNDKKEIKKICIYGVGGVGGYFGGLLANRISEQHDKEREVYFVGRGAHLQEIKKNGLILNTSDRNGLVCKPSCAVEHFNELPAVDLILLAVKSYDLDETVRSIAPHVTQDTMIIALLNGVDIHYRIRTRLTAGIVLPACVYVFSSIEKPGTVTQKGPAAKLIFGKDPGHPDIVPQNVIDLFKFAGINSKWTENAVPAIWGKYLFIAPFALVTGRYGATFGAIMENPELKEKTRCIMHELIAIARCEGVEFPDSIVSENLDKAGTFPYESKSSYQRDLGQKGKKNEGDLFGETIIRLGKKYGVKTPITDELYMYIQKNLQ